MEILAIYNQFKIIFLSIIIEAMPFLFIGSLVASIIELYIDEETIKKILPKNIFLQIFLTPFLGLIFPICECAIIPITRKLITKGVPVGTALVFMLAVPIINPIAITATYFAFPNNPEIVWYRIIVGFIVATGIGLLFAHYRREDVIKLNTKNRSDTSSHCHAHCHCTDLSHQGSKIGRIIKHARNEFFDVGLFLIIGAFFSASVQVFLPEKFITGIAGFNIFSILSLQLFAYLLSLCSHADAFVAAGFMYDFPFFAVLAFLITSPLIDLKNTLILYGSFDGKFSRNLIIKIFTMIFIVIFILSRN